MRPRRRSGASVIVVDASALLVALTDDGPAGTRVRERIDADEARAPSLIDIEVASALRRRCALGLLSQQRSQQALDDLVRLPLPRIEQRALLRRAWELRDNVSVYDAVYVALAEACRTTLVTTDARLARAPGIRCAVEVLT